MKFSITKISNLLRKKYQFINIAYLFGSAVSGTVREGGDIDIAVSVDNKYLQANLEIALNIEVFLQEVYGCPVDVITLNKANVMLKYQIIKNGIRLFERDSKLRAYTELCIIKEYFDMVYYQNKRKNAT